MKAGTENPKIKVKDSGVILAFSVRRNLTTHSTRAEIEGLSCARLAAYDAVCRRVNSGVGRLFSMAKFEILAERGGGT